MPRSPVLTKVERDSPGILRPTALPQAVPPQKMTATELRGLLAGLHDLCCQILTIVSIHGDRLTKIEESLEQTASVLERTTPTWTPRKLAAESLGVSFHTLKRWMDTGFLTQGVHYRNRTCSKILRWEVNVLEVRRLMKEMGLD